MKPVNPMNYALPLLALAVVSLACGTPPPVDKKPDDGGDTITAACTDPTTVSCIDQAEQDLSMTPNDSTPGLVQDAKSGDHFHAKIDATAGGGAFDATQGFVYAKFTKDGLQKVDITDDESFTSMDWDISFRRFVVRLNSGSGGPSCVTAARTASNTKFADVTSVDPGLTFNAEHFMQSDCSEITDGGIGGPSVVLGNYWQYPSGCLSMTHNVYVLELADGHHVKLEMTAYYGPNQDACESDGTATESTSANLELDWAFLD